MSSYDDQVRRDARLAYEQQQKSARDAAIESANSLGRDAARLKLLSENVEWKWFLETHLLPFVLTEHDAALDTHHTATERDASAHRHAAAREVVEMLGKKAQSASEAAQRAFSEIPPE